MTLHALTLHQPWAWAIAHVDKNVENREWQPPGALIGKWLAIHAGKKVDHQAVRELQEAGYDCPEPDDLTKSAIICVVKISGLLLAGDAIPPEHNLWFTGPVGWVFSEKVRIPPVACRGYQGLWPVRAVELEMIRASWTARRRAEVDADASLNGETK